MVVENWVREHFEVIPDGWDNETGHEPAFVFNINGITVKACLRWFIERFGPDAPTSVNDLKNRDPENTSGWHQIFNTWGEQGLLPVI